jgi:hypothetical protein
MEKKYETDLNCQYEEKKEKRSKAGRSIVNAAAKKESEVKTDACWVFKRW